MKQRKSQRIALILFTLCSVLIGALGGMWVTRYASSQTGGSLPALLYAIFCMVAAYYLSVVIHESGHLVMGLRTGYSFVSFRIGSLTLIRQEGKLRLKRFRVAGTGGQCILTPPETDRPENAPFTLYYLGGGLFNLLTAAVVFPPALLLSNFWVRLPLLVLGVVSLYQGAFNLIPLNLQIPNDGYTLRLLRRSPAERAAVYRQLKANGLLYGGMTPAELPETLLSPEPPDRSGVFTSAEILTRGSVAVDRHDFAAAEQIFTDCLQSGMLLPIYENECRCELLFCKLMNGAPAEEIEALYTKQLRTYVKRAGQTQIAKRRLLYAWEKLFRKDETAAQREYEAARKMRAVYPCPGELKSELALMAFLAGDEGESP